MTEVFLHGRINIASGHQPTTTAPELREETKDRAPATEAPRQSKPM
jgi:hypothetical protein